MIKCELPGGKALEIRHLVVDLNGTLTEHGRLIDGVKERLVELALRLDVHVLTADTFGTADQLRGDLPVPIVTIARGSEKAALVGRLGAEHTAAIGNGRNDEAMLRLAALGIAVIGHEGAATSTILASDLTCVSIVDALALLLDERVLVSTLRP